MKEVVSDVAVFHMGGQSLEELSELTARRSSFISIEKGKEEKQVLTI
jgi:hypothetical protein